ncbi:MAG: serpin family protein, partial [Anaeroplasmataceae bacterium]|nr:serpin family protein [Anaeroplasmataceae bacterium]
DLSSDLNNDLVGDLKDNEDDKKDTDEEKRSVILEKLSSFSSDFTASAYQHNGKKDNFVVSPLSVFMALSMIEATTQDSSSNQILNTIDLTHSEMVQLSKTLLSTMNKEYYSDELIENDGHITRQKAGLLNITNSLWSNSAVELKRTAVLNLIDSLDTDVFKVDFEDSNKTSQRIVEYVKDKTEGIIDLKEVILDKDSAFILLNTLYLKDGWGVSDLQFTESVYDFMNNDGQITKTNLLTGGYFLGRVQQTEKYKHFYTKTQNGYKLKFIVPNNQYSIEDVFTKETIAEVNSISNYHSVDEGLKTKYYTRCLFPKFKVRFDDDIASTLQLLGIKDVFDKDKANFTALIDEKFHFSNIRHVVDLKVNEQGIIGAAVTLGTSFGAPNDPYKKAYEDFVVDRSFGFIVTDSNDVQIFSGVIKNI